ncbi:MAG TPA: RICIN domain-containing protein, partial [Thermoanaerobaculia bacterium]
MTERLLIAAFVVLAPLPALAQGFVPDPLTAEVRMLDGTREMCLDVPDNRPDDQLYLQMFPCHGGSNQRWLLRFDFSGFVILESEGTHRCLDVPNTSTVQQFRCHGGDNQRWQLFEDPETLRFRLRPKLSRDRCLHVSDVNNRMDLVACDPTPGAVRFSRARWERQNFEFRLQQPLAAFAAVINEDRQWCLDVAGLSQDNNAIVQTYPCNGGRNQLWRLVREADGFFRLQADHSQKCLRRTGGSGGVDQAACDGTDRQKWFPQLTSTGRVKLQTREPLCHQVPGPSDANPRGFCECLNAEPNSQALHVLRCASAGDLWRLGPGRRAPGALTFFEDNGVRGDRVCGLPP